MDLNPLRNVNWCLMQSKRLTFAALLLAGSSLLFAAPALAQSPHYGHPPSGHGGPPGGHAPHFAFTHHDFAHFSPAEHASWVGGRWNHGWHNGRMGWWWFAGGAWYFYDTPTYPYPTYVSDYYADDEGYGPGAPGQFWYYCSAPPGYYPYIQTCRTPWQPVPASPPPQGYGPPPGYQGGPGGQPPPGYGPGPGDQPPPGYQGPNNGPGPQDQPPPGYQQGPGDQPPPGYQGPGPDDGPPPGYQGPGAPPPNNPPPNGYNGPGGPN
jgi:hypothetical protein